MYYDNNILLYIFLKFRLNINYRYFYIVNIVPKIVKREFPWLQLMI